MATLDPHDNEQSRARVEGLAHPRIAGPEAGNPGGFQHVDAPVRGLLPFATQSTGRAFGAVFRRWNGLPVTCG
jgi:hypothetical protein